MNNLNWTTTYRGLKVITSVHCYDRKVKYRAVAVVVDQRRPNKVKPIFKRKRFETKTPTAYMMGDTLVCHPDYLAAIQKKMGEQMQKSIEDEIRKLWGMV